MTIYLYMYYKIINTRSIFIPYTTIVVQGKKSIVNTCGNFILKIFKDFIFRYLLGVIWPKDRIIEITTFATLRIYEYFKLT